MGIIINFKSKMNKISFFNSCFFMISPILSLPFLFFGIYKKNKISLILLMFFGALITYQLVPHETSDLFQHYRFYNQSLYKPIKIFIRELLNKPDFVIYLGSFLFAKIGLSPQLFFSILTYLTLFYMYKVYNKLITNDVSKSNYLIGIILIFFSIELLGLYSGIRNLLASSILLYSFYLGIFENKKRKSLTFFIFSFLVHYGTLIFIPVYVFSIYWNLTTKKILYIYICSFIGIFLSKSYLYDLALLLPLPEAFDAKIRAYLFGLDLAEKGFLESKSAYISYMIRISWVFFAHLYLFVTYKRQSPLRKSVLMSMCLLNVFHLAPDINMRLTYFIEPLFIYLLYHEINYKYNKIIIITFFIYIIPSFVVNIIINRVFFINSLFNIDFLSLIGILLKKVELEFLW